MNFKKIFQDIVAKILAYGGLAIGLTGYASDADIQAVMGGVAAAVGIIWTAITKGRIAKEVAVVATAVDTNKSTAEILANPILIAPVGEAARDSSKKNFGSR